MPEVWHEDLLWAIFGVTVVIMLALDLGVFHRKSKVIELKEALIWSAVWIIMALAFCVGIYFLENKAQALDFLAAYLIEKSLSADNLFVFLLIFSYFNIPRQYQHRVLFWGILGALLIRAVMIAAGLALIQLFHWVIYIFGAFLVFTGIKMARNKETEISPEKNPLLNFIRRYIGVTKKLHGERFFIRNKMAINKRRGRYIATPLFVVLVVIETTDVMFAVDSIPAVLAVTFDPFIVYTSNIFAILGLRALYFALAGMMAMFHYLHYGLSGILVFVGMKMLISDIYKVPIALSLGVILAMLTASVIASIVMKPKQEALNEGAS